MPELPEVETTRQGIAPHCEGQTIQRVIVRNPSLRWPVPADLAEHLEGKTIRAVERRAKYLFLHLETGSVIVHLGMSGSLRVITDDSPAMTHDHVELVLGNHRRLRFNDPRRFGCWLWTTDWNRHPLISALGPEPLSEDFNGAWLFRLSRQKQTPVKSFIMDNHVVVGVGNIYASEALFKAGIRPTAPAGKIGRVRLARLVNAIQQILRQAIRQGGTTISDYRGSGSGGRFQQRLSVYGRAGEPCASCQRPLQSLTMAGRNTFFCAACQK